MTFEKLLKETDNRRRWCRRTVRDKSGDDECKVQYAYIYNTGYHNLKVSSKHTQLNDIILKSSNPILYRLRVWSTIEFKKIRIELIFFQRLTPSYDVRGR